MCPAQILTIHLKFERSLTLEYQWFLTSWRVSGCLHIFKRLSFTAPDSSCSRFFFSLAFVSLPPQWRSLYFFCMYLDVYLALIFQILSGTHLCHQHQCRNPLGTKTTKTLFEYTSVSVYKHPIVGFMVRVIPTFVTSLFNLFLTILSFFLFRICLCWNSKTTPLPLSIIGVLNGKGSNRNIVFWPMESFSSSNMNCFILSCLAIFQLYQQPSGTLSFLKAYMLSFSVCMLLDWSHLKHFHYSKLRIFFSLMMHSAVILCFEALELELPSCSFFLNFIRGNIFCSCVNRWNE